MDETNKIPTVPTFSDFYEIFLNWPMQTQIGIVLFFSIWVIGGNILVYISMRRRDLPWWKAFIPTTRVFRGFNKTEFIILALLAIASLSSGMWGISAQHQQNSNNTYNQIAPR